MTKFFWLKVNVLVRWMIKEGICSLISNRWILPDELAENSKRKHRWLTPNINENQLVEGDRPLFLRVYRTMLCERPILMKLCRSGTHEDTQNEWTLLSPGNSDFGSKSNLYENYSLSRLNLFFFFLNKYHLEMPMFKYYGKIELITNIIDPIQWGFLW